MNRTFILGAGFSRAIAGGSLMKDIWGDIEKAYEKERNRKVSISGGNNRISWFEKINDFIKK